jgi:hypothetical protein
MSEEIFLDSATAQGNGSILQQSPGSRGAALVSSDGSKYTYRFAINDATPVAAPTDVFIIQGSATKTLRIKRLQIFGESTAAGSIGFVITRRSTAGTPGSAVLTAIVPAKHDINDPASTATVSTVGTANYTTLGDSAGLIEAGLLTFGNGGTVSNNNIAYDYATRQDKAVILRGVSDFICIGGVGDALPTGAKLYMAMEMEEDNS